MVTLLSGGACVVDRRQLDCDHLLAALREAAEPDRDRSSPGQPSLTGVRLRAAGTLSVGDVTRAMEACEDPWVRINRLDFAVRNPDGRERARALTRAITRGIVKGHLGETIPSDRTHCAIPLPSAGERAAAAVVAAVKALPWGWTARPVSPGVQPPVLHADVILLLDALPGPGANGLTIRRLQDGPAPLAAAVSLHRGDPLHSAIRFCPWECPAQALDAGSVPRVLLSTPAGGTSMYRRKPDTMRVPAGFPLRWGA